MRDCRPQAISGDVDSNQILDLTTKWFGSIERRDVPKRAVAKEEKQKESRKLTEVRDVPANVIYRAYHMSSRLDNDYYSTDLISDVLSNGKSSRFYQTLVHEKKLFTDIDAYITGSIDPGLFIINGKPFPGISIEKAEKAIDEEIYKIKNELVSDYELRKVKNKIESSLMFSEMKNLNKAMNLAYYELLGDAAMLNKEIDKYEEITQQQLINTARKIFSDENCSTLYYLSDK